MDALALSPRRIPSPTRRALHSPAPSSCVDVQWTFLPTQPPSRPSHSRQQSPIRTPGRMFDAYDDAHAREELQIEQLRLRKDQDAADLHHQRVLYDLMGETQRKAMLDKVMADMEAMALTPIRRVGQNRHHPGKPSPAPSATTRRSSMAHAKTRSDDVALLPQRRLSALGHDDKNDEDEDESAWQHTFANDRDDDDDNHDGQEDEDGHQSDRDQLDLPELRAIRERHRHRVAGKSTDHGSKQSELRILWQKSAHVRLAIDLPPALTEIDSYDTSAPSVADPIAPLSDLFPLSEESVREQQRYLSRRASKLKEDSPEKSPTSKSQVCGGFQSPSPQPKRVHKAHYGSWYVPRNEWWPQHETERDALAELYPEEMPPPVERHQCNSSGVDDRPQKVPAPPQPDHPYRWPSVLRAPIRVASPRSSTSRSSAPSSAVPPTPLGMSSPRGSYASTPASSGLSRNQVGRTEPAPSPRASLSPDPIAQRAIELQHEIPQAYIAREYRNYLLAKGARVPSYLNY